MRDIKPIIQLSSCQVAMLKMPQPAFLVRQSPVAKLVLAKVLDE